MDKRQRKTREAIFKAFIELLSKKDFNSITVGEIIEMGEHNHRHIFNCDAPESVFLHLFYHLQKNDNRILDLLSGENNDLFLQYFKKGLIALVESQIETLKKPKHNGLPQGFLINHIAANFVETVRWWADNDCRQSADTITQYFLWAI